MHPTACAGNTWPDLFALWESGFGEQVQDITLPTTIAVRGFFRLCFLIEL